MFGRLLISNLLLFAVFGLSGCVGGKQYYDTKPFSLPVSGEVKDKVYERFSDPFVIEFDDQGELWDIPSWVEGDGKLSQFEVTRDAIRKARMLGYEVILIEYFHGWKHNAKRNSDKIEEREPSNLHEFSNYIGLLNSLEQKRGSNTVYVGVFFAWRGTPWTTMRGVSKKNPIRLLNMVPLTLTFWNRLDAANRVARASATYVMMSLAAEVKSEQSYGPSGKVLIIGHSFGGRIVERTVAQFIVGSLAMNPLIEGKRQSVRPADLIVLLNPASESILSRQIAEALSDPDLDADNDVVDTNPWIVSISSRADKATSIIYGLGARLRWSTREYRQEGRNQFSYFVRPAPHNKEFRNYAVLDIDIDVGDGVADELEEVLRLNSNTDGYLDDYLRSIGLGEMGNAIVTSEGVFQLSALSSLVDHPRYWAMLVPNQIIGGHNDIFTHETVALISALLRISNSIDLQNIQKTAQDDVRLMVN